MTEELKKTIESAQTEEDKNKDEIKKLQDEDLKGVAGGAPEIFPKLKYRSP